MRLSKVATYFNKTTFADAYIPSSTFKGRLLPFDDATRDSLSSERRIMSVAPDVVVPARRTVTCGGQTWLVGDPAPDMHRDELLRNKFILHQASGIAQIRTFAGAIQGVGTKDLWSNRLWIKGTKETDESSGVYEGYGMYFSRAEDLRDPAWATGKFIDGREYNVLAYLDGRWHLIRSVYGSAGGFMVALVDELPEPVLTAVTFQIKAYNAKTDTDVPTPKTVQAVNIRWQSHFTHLARYSQSYLSGDSQIVVCKADMTGLVPKAGDSVTLQNRPYKVMSVVDEDPCLSIHIRHA